MTGFFFPQGVDFNMAKASLAEAMAALGSEVKAGESHSLPEDPMVRKVREPVEWYLPCHCLRLGIYLWAAKQARLLEIYRRQSQSVFYLWVRQHLPWWKRWAPKAVLHLIEAGLEKPTSLVNRLSCLIQDKSKEDLLAADSILQEYLQVGAVRKLPMGSPSRHYVPWFIIRKKDGEKEKLRLIADCREINVYFQTSHFKLDNLHQI